MKEIHNKHHGKFLMCKTATLLLLILLTSSCNFFHRKLPDTIPKEYPSRYSMYSSDPDYNIEWWKQLNSTELNNLIDMAVNENFTVLEAWARLEQAKAQAAKSASFLYPDVSVNAGAAENRQTTKGSDKVSSTNYSLGLLVNYEIDLWGKISAADNSSRLQLKASRDDVSTAVMSIAAQIAETWINLISVSRQEESLKEQLVINKKLFELIELRLKHAKASSIDLYQQQQAIAAINTAMIPIAAQKQLLRHQLALLLGKPANYNIEFKQKKFPLISDIPEPGLPLDLLSMRPDIRAAGLRLKASNWEITVAKADRLPALKLTASHTYSSNEFSTIFDNWLMNLAANATGPVFDAGRRENEVKRVKAVVDERLAAYRKTVITAIKEVEDALVKEKHDRQSLTAKQQQLLISQKTVKKAGSRYLNGLNDYLPVLREQLNIALFKNSIIKARADIIISRIQLQKAVGGSWTDKIKPEKL